MNVLEKIASGIGRSDDLPNKELAGEIIRQNQNQWVEQLIVNLKHKDKNIQSDCIKVLYEIGLQGGNHLIVPYYQDFADLLSSKNNRLVWGAMIALETISGLKTAEVFGHLESVLKAMECGSVITIDNGVGILAKLSADKRFAPKTFPLLLKQLQRCPAKQLPMYAEKAMVAIHSENRATFIALIEKRLPEMNKDSQRSRLKKILKKLQA